MKNRYIKKIINLLYNIYIELNPYTKIQKMKRERNKLKNDILLIEKEIAKKKETIKRTENSKSVFMNLMV